MKTPTLDEMKLAAARLVPEQIIAETGEPVPDGWIPPQFKWASNSREILKTEWLHVCWLAEKSLTPAEWREYYTALGWLADRESSRTFASINAHSDIRLEALCRVKHPEMFQ